MSKLSESYLGSFRDVVDGEITDSTIEHLPPTVISELLSGAYSASDPSTRDFGERYKYRSVLGEGGQGIVLDAYDTVLDREVAIKALKEHGPEIREEYLEREARISGILEHPNIPPTYDLGHDEANSPFFVMRKVEGTPLDEILRRSRSSRKSSTWKKMKAVKFSRLRLLSIFVQICNAIEYAHSRGVLHLDIKPQNIKLGPFGEVFVLDWGFAIRKDERPKIVGGTPIYIAPERLRREPPDERADVYSLGVLLYRLLTGRRPFEVKNLNFEEYREQYEGLEQIPARVRDNTIPRDLDAIVTKAIAKVKEIRYQSVHDLAADLQRFLDGVPVTAYEVGLIQRSWKAIRRHTVVSALIATLTMLSIASIAVVTHNHTLAIRHEQEEAAREAAQAIRNQALLPFQKGRALLDKPQPNLEVALDLFSRAIAIDPTFDESFFERGKVHNKLGGMGEAIADFRQTLLLNPNRIMAHYHAGIIQMEILKDLAQAEKEFTAMQEIDPDDEYSNLGLARLHTIAGQYDEALDLCRRIEERNPSLIEVNDLRGYIYSKKGQGYEDQALAAYNAYLTTPSQNASAYSNRGDLLLRQNQIDLAIADYNLALETTPRYVHALRNRGWALYLYKHDTASALADFNLILDEIDPVQYATYLSRAAVYEYLQEWEKAENDYNWAYDYSLREMERVDGKSLSHLGHCYFRQGKFEQALSAFERAIPHAREERQPALQHLLGLTLYAESRYEEALPAFESAIKLGVTPLFESAVMQHITRLRLLQESDPERLLAIATGQTGKPWLKAVAGYWLGRPQFSEENLPTTPQAKCEYFYYRGMARLLLGKNPQAAAADFRQCIATGVHLYNQYALAQSELDKIANNTLQHSSQKGNQNQ